MAAFTTRPEILGTFGVVASTHWLATASGMAILEKGGNAFDAACATGFALQVVEPHMCGLGGDVPMILATAGGERAEVICGQGPAPEAATLEAYRALGIDLIPGNGLLAAVVPGAFDAWLLLLERFGTMTLADVLAAAIGYARDGHPIHPNVVDVIAGVRPLFEDEWPTSAAVYLPGGQPPCPESLFRNPVLAETYQRLVDAEAAAHGSREAGIAAARGAFYEGFVAEAIDRYCRENEVMDASGERHRGFLTADDMARWRATIEAPVTYDYHGTTVCKTGPWGQGPVFLQQLALLKGFDLSGMSADDPDFVHTVVECAKLAYADREAYYGDPDFVDVPLETLLSDDYNDARRALIGEEASLALVPGAVPGFEPRIVQPAPPEETAGALGVGEPTIAGPNRPAGPAAGDTVHFDIVDRHGNFISATPSGGWLQSSPVIPELGFCLPTRAQMFWIEDGLPSSLAAGKRPRTTLTPSLALRDGKPYMAFGTPGGDQQDQWSLHFLLRHLHFGLNLQEAIDAPSFHSEHFPSSFYPRQASPGRLVMEGRFSSPTLAELERRGHLIELADDWSEGRMTAAVKDGDILKAAANARQMQNYAIGR
ncbi:MAG: gamma-glutamyltransferase family protein [Rhodospirillales bacterium]|jgi:gamma-glutamyltranspeptidase/glutathione hydrolase|nr:gamma-glutamyltransferase family protein [Rhodospirillales bacterium]